MLEHLKKRDQVKATTSFRAGQLVQQPAKNLVTFGARFGGGGPVQLQPTGLEAGLPRQIEEDSTPATDIEDAPQAAPLRERQRPVKLGPVFNEIARVFQLAVESFVSSQCRRKKLK